MLENKDKLYDKPTPEKQFYDGHLFFKLFAVSMCHFKLLQPVVIWRSIELYNTPRFPYRIPVLIYRIFAIS